MADCPAPGAVRPQVTGPMNVQSRPTHGGPTPSPDYRQAKVEPLENQTLLCDIAYFNPEQCPKTTFSHEYHQQPSPDSTAPRSRGSTQPSASPSGTAPAPKPLTFKEFVSPAAARKSKHERHSRQEWDSRKDVIHKLYIEEGRPLRDVMKIMESRGFKAT
ncbi:uncharacterized protein B0I36DRAFT_101660 [Microdochium trichocladiopsis]|uniref:Clr5 domain-containing protein n=1 Tax=Microdochium trichocladiopsis TaxID=1682393 RepID=A0A9P9BP85_9PEZI|nr:uncharacterized protein B0I36DRAFT_101660 [Microdochium trichocladiopsis]KAH7032874.1 hypothetical protein B0I36DRAFT_101660 [Microdochium trichocladiopsis]